jgi:hypothetical protein
MNRILIRINVMDIKYLKHSKYSESVGEHYFCCCHDFLNIISIITTVNLKEASANNFIKMREVRSLWKYSTNTTECFLNKNNKARTNLS